jgi:hypothetical protein
LALKIPDVKGENSHDTVVEKPRDFEIQGPQVLTEAANCVMV